MPKKIRVKVFLDKNFATKFWEIEPNALEIAQDFQDNFLFNSAGITLYCNYDSSEEFMANATENPLLEALLEGNPELILSSWNNKSEFVLTSAKESGFKIYFIDLPDEECNTLSHKTGYKIINTNTLYASWGGFVTKTIVKDLDSPPDSKDPYSFKSWSDLAFIGEVPSNNIIIQDNYILADKSERISDNLLPLIEAIISSNQSLSIDIVIISEKIKEKEYAKTNQKKAEQIHAYLHSNLAKYKNSKIHISIIIHDKSFYPIDSPDFHDRHIYTNYYSLRSGKGFNLFRGQRRVLSNSEVVVNFNFQSRHIRILPRRMESIINYIEKLKRVEVYEKFKYYPEIQCSILGY